ncbi:unnamed protein product [Acanthoscelides obtectus]|uniref:Uncharacterized protein n=1 Tax=Acanthoscelides obtectus TaxID=200917 RepID=A0A9P0JQK9_ACAOB|nr:unnamed protein product [Acanthoscelides obtectus]CAK1640270.1 hypothetical protein AOBTE_LOCUS11630 [Acanthoscelides obtectus]
MKCKYKNILQRRYSDDIQEGKVKKLAKLCYSLLGAEIGLNEKWIGGRRRLDFSCVVTCSLSQAGTYIQYPTYSTLQTKLSTCLTTTLEIWSLKTTSLKKFRYLYVLCVVDFC